MGSGGGPARCLPRCTQDAALRVPPLSSVHQTPAYLPRSQPCVPLRVCVRLEALCPALSVKAQILSGLSLDSPVICVHLLSGTTLALQSQGHSSGLLEDHCSKWMADLQGRK